MTGLPRSANWPSPNAKIHLELTHKEITSIRNALSDFARAMYGGMYRPPLMYPKEDDKPEKYDFDQGPQRETELHNIAMKLDDQLPKTPKTAPVRRWHR